MESARIRARHSSGSGVSSILQPVNGVRYVDDLILMSKLMCVE